MRVLLQRVTQATVRVAKKNISSINFGILVFIGIEVGDDEKTANKIIDKILNYRVFNDENDKININIKDAAGDILVISQFTLVADTKSGTRAGFSTAMKPAPAKKLYDYFTTMLKQKHPATAFGIFAADMQINLTNDGPISFILEVK